MFKLNKGLVGLVFLIPILVVFYFNFTSSKWTFSQTTTVAQLTQNNTSACGNSTSPCTGAWNPTQTVKYDSGIYAGQTKTVNGFWDNAVSSGAQAPTSAYGYVSKIPVSVLLPGYNVPVVAETQNWWGNGNGHINNGENSENLTQMKNQMADHVSRGFAGQVLDWYGYTSGGKLVGQDDQQDIAALNTIANISSYQYGPQPYKFALMVDKGFFVGCGNTVACLNSALSYMATTYFNSPYYMKDSSGHPLVFFFINSYYPDQYAVLTSSGINYQNSKFVMYEPNGFPGNEPNNTDGEYSWINPGDSSSYTTTSGSMGTFSWESDFGFLDYSGFLTNAENNQGSYIVSEVYKGFNDNLANWSLNRIIDQQCGQTWLESFNHTGSFGGSSTYLANLNYLKLGKRLDMIMVDTWDDYEEGSQIETGIDNCVSSFTTTLSGNTLSWTPTWGKDPMNSAVSGSENTIYKYSVFMAAQGSTSLMWIADVMCTSVPCSHSVDVSKYGITGGPYVFYVWAVGQPSIVNHLAGPTTATYTSGGSGSLSVTLSKPANGATNILPEFEISGTAKPVSGATISTMTFVLDGGTPKVFKNNEWPSYFPSPALAPGVHSVQLTAIDSLGNTGTQTSTFTVVAPTSVTAQIISPVNYQSVGPTVWVTGVANAPQGINSIQIYVDNKVVVTMNQSYLYSQGAAIPLPLGNHTVVVKGWEGNNSALSATITVNRTK